MGKMEEPPPVVGKARMDDAMVLELDATADSTHSIRGARVSGLRIRLSATCDRRHRTVRRHAKERAGKEGNQDEI